jgi:ribonuclease HII
MINPTFKQEKQLLKKGYKFIAGIDEAGRGPLAGPVVAGAVVFRDFKLKKFKGLRDSKQLTPLQREKFYKILTNNSLIDYGIGIVSEKIVDRVNILEASFLAMKKAVKNLKISPDFLLIDGRWTLKDYPVSQTAIANGDRYIFSIAAASIIAKVYRDRMLIKFHRRYPDYGFDRHKGYGTKFHLEMLKKYGPCQIHRQSFKPIKMINDLGIKI